MPHSVPPAAPLPEEDLRTLYLVGREGVRVKREGASVAVTVPGRAQQRVPARRVGRVIIFGDVTLPVSALTLFSERGVPITFIDARGRTRGILVHPNPPEDPRGQGWFRSLRADEVSRRQVRRLFAAHRRRLQLGALAAIGSPMLAYAKARGMRENDYQEWLRAAVRPDTPREPIAVIRRSLRTLLLNWCGRALTAARIDGRVGLVDPHRPLGLAEEIANTLYPICDPVWVRLFRKKDAIRHFVTEGLEWAISPRHSRWFIAPYERQGPRLQKAFDHLLRDLLTLPWDIPYGRHA
ncbi:MAG: hypothetical protein D6739_00765 [Nitrospirae bacterium]|nr:MAG: hypothetical protein D6739_00765 [Nitrospirota bacterium]